MACLSASSFHTAKTILSHGFLECRAHSKFSKLSVLAPMTFYFLRTHIHDSRSVIRNNSLASEITDSDPANLEFKRHYLPVELLITLQSLRLQTHQIVYRRRIMTTAPLPPPRDFFHSIYNIIDIIRFDYCCHNFSCSILKVDCIPPPLPDETLSFSFPEPFTSYIVDSRPNSLRVDVIESTFWGFKSTASLFMEEVFDSLAYTLGVGHFKGQIGFISDHILISSFS